MTNPVSLYFVPLCAGCSCPLWLRNISSVLHTVGPTALHRPSPAPHLRNFKVFIYSDLDSMLPQIQPCASQPAGEWAIPTYFLVRNSSDVTRALAVAACFGWRYLLKQTVRNWVPQPRRRKMYKGIWVRYVRLAFLSITELSPELYPDKISIFFINTSKRIPRYDHPADHRMFIFSTIRRKITA